MSMDVAYSVNQIPIRLTDERWSHIVNAHDDLAGYYDDCLDTIESPDLILRGLRGSLKAIRDTGEMRKNALISGPSLHFASASKGVWAEPVSGRDLPRAEPERRLRGDSLLRSARRSEKSNMAALGKKEKRRAVSGALALAQLVGRFPARKLWLDYDEEADVLYVSLKRPQQATETVDLEGEGVLLRYRDKQLVGITVLDASRHKP
jgi:uncharacterized protein YuzE